jgi:ABC-type bacteriocin/lantibiotic exporter with double-glycine peptidase domain
VSEWLSKRTPNPALRPGSAEGTTGKLIRRARAAWRASALLALLLVPMTVVLPPLLLLLLLLPVLGLVLLLLVLAVLLLLAVLAVPVVATDADALRVVLVSGARPSSSLSASCNICF